MRGWLPDASCERTWGWGEACHSGSLSDKLPPLSPAGLESWLCFGLGEEPAFGSSSFPPLSLSPALTLRIFPARSGSSSPVGSQFALTSGCPATLLPPTPPPQLHLLWADFWFSLLGTYFPTHCFSYLCR